MRLFIYRILQRLSLYFHNYWWLTYTTLSAVSGFLIIDFFFDYKPTGFQDSAVAIGALAVIAIAIRQQKDIKSQIVSAQIPEVARTTENHFFDWNSGLLKVTNPKKSPLDDKKGLLQIQIMGNTYVSNLHGYILHGGYLYPILFGPVDSVEVQEKSLKFYANLTQTWAKGQTLYLIPYVEKRRKIAYSGSYYCVAFATPLGEKYYLEEDHRYVMNLKSLSVSRPKWKTDYLFDYYFDF